MTDTIHPTGATTGTATAAAATPNGPLSTARSSRSSSA